MKWDVAVHLKIYKIRDWIWILQKFSYFKWGDSHLEDMYRIWFSKMYNVWRPGLFVTLILTQFIYFTLYLAVCVAFYVFHAFYDQVSLWHPSWPNWMEEALAAAEWSGWVGELDIKSIYKQQEVFICIYKQQENIRSIYKTSIYKWI